MIGILTVLLVVQIVILVVSCKKHQVPWSESFDKMAEYLNLGSKYIKQTPSDRIYQGVEDGFGLSFHTSYRGDSDVLYYVYCYSYEAEWKFYEYNSQNGTIKGITDQENKRLSMAWTGVS